MSFLQALLLGIVQGLTEFLPISSSAHLVLVPFFLGWSLPEQQAFIFNVLVQDGTLLAVIIYFWKDLWNIITHFFQALFQGRPFSDPDARLGWYLILATIPAGLLGLIIKKVVEAAFNSVIATAIFLLVTAAILFIAEWIGKRERRLSDINWLDALWIGIAQAVAIFPGISRSGATIAGGLARNFERPSAARFAFLMSIPVMLAAGLLEGLDMIKTPGLESFLPVVAVGFVTAAVVGYFSIRWLIGYLMHHSLRVFAYYCIAIAAITLIVALIRG